jgi:protein-tyrosine kinase
MRNHPNIDPSADHGGSNLLRHANLLVQRLNDWPQILRAERIHTASLVNSLRRMSVSLLTMPRVNGTTAMVVASPDAKDGRSLLAAGLATLLSMGGRRTLLVDADLRRPVQHKLFVISAEKGLADCLVNRTVTPAVQPLTAIPQLSLLPAGQTQHDPSDLLARETFGEMLRELGNGYDFVVIDTPPASVYVDAQIAAAQAGNAIMLLRKDSTRLADASQLADWLQAGNTRVLGTVLNEY